MKKISSNNFIKFFIIPFLLIFFWWISSLLFNNKISFSTLVYKEGVIIQQTDKGKLLKGNKILGEFISKDNHLGIIILNLKDFVKPDYRGEDVLSFKLKEKGDRDWFVVNNYRSGLMEHQLQFPFGFPQIENSKGKIYQFEITSLYGNDTNAIELSNSKYINTAYQYSRKEIAGSKLRLVSFIFKKTINSLSNLDFLLSSILYLLPFCAYLIWEIQLKRVKVVRQIFSVVVLLLILVDIFFLQEIYLGLLIFLILSWLVSIKLNNLESSVSFFLAGFLIIIWLVFMLINNQSFYNKLNIWVFAFLLLGVIQSIFEEMGILKPEVDYKRFISKTFKINIFK